MFVEVDAKALEWVAAVYLSKDQVGYEEIRSGFDQHSDNQQRFELPTRLVAKTFLFRLIYGGSAYAYGNDPEFTFVSSDQDFWQDCIDKFYRKYNGLHRWHTEIVREVIRSKEHCLVIPTGRKFVYERDKKGNWPRTTILNYPVQGFGADLMSIARVSLARRLRSNNLHSLLVCTVHDSILLDCPNDEVDQVIKIIYSVWEDLPTNFERVFHIPFDLPCRCEVSVGQNWGDMEEIK